MPSFSAQRFVSDAGESLGLHRFGRCGQRSRVRSTDESAPRSAQAVLCVSREAISQRASYAVKTALILGIAHLQVRVIPPNERMDVTDGHKMDQDEKNAL
jgi:hypothetical protein